jgi:predicted dinucleotide-binding enzyme
MNIGIIGTGHVAATLAERWAASGHAVTLGSRDPGAASTGFPVASVAEVVRGHDVLVNATPGAVSLEALGAVDPGAYAGKVVIDVANAVGPSFDLLYPNSSLGERLAEALPDAKIVKTLNTAAMTVLTEPTCSFPVTMRRRRPRRPGCCATSAGPTTASSTSEASRPPAASSTTSCCSQR